jgi:hypothetical protein
MVILHKHPAPASILEMVLLNMYHQPSVLEIVILIHIQHQISILDGILKYRSIISLQYGKWCSYIQYKPKVPEMVFLYTPPPPALSSIDGILIRTSIIKTHIDGFSLIDISNRNL